MSSYLNFVRPEKKYSNYQSTNFMKEKYLYRTLEETVEDWVKYLSLWKSYPDYFIDFISDESTKIELHPYQRLFLRAYFRHKRVFISAARGSSKTYTEILAMYLQCIFYPGIDKFITAPLKEMAAVVSQETIEDIWDHFPVLKHEIEKKEFGKDKTVLRFFNGSKLSIVQMNDNSRGLRRHGGSVEEIVHPKFDPDKLHKVVIPMMSKQRTLVCGGIDRHEIHGQEWYCTSSGTRQSYAFDKLKEINKRMINGESAIVLLADYTLGCMHGILNVDQVEEQRNTISLFDFQREYLNIWTGSSDKSLVNLKDLNDCRILDEAEDSSTDKEAEYVLAFDVARAEGSKNAQSALCVIKIKKKNNFEYSKHLVNLYSFEGTHFLEQAKFLKKQVEKYKAKVLIIDSNGLGKGIVDYLVTDIDSNPVYSVINDDRYDKYKTPTSIPMIYSLSTNTAGHKNSDIFNRFVTTISNKDVKLLKHSAVFKVEMLSQRGIKDPEKQAEKLRPYMMVDLLCDEISNLEHRQRGNETAIHQISKEMPKDKFMAFCYGLYWIYLEEQKNKLQSKENLGWENYMLF